MIGNSSFSEIFRPIVNPMIVPEIKAVILQTIVRKCFFIASFTSVVLEIYNCVHHTGHPKHHAGQEH